jgi:hypothetical protein
MYTEVMNFVTGKLIDRSEESKYGIGPMDIDQCCGSGSDPNPDSMGPWIRIRIRIRDPDPDPGGQKLPTNFEKTQKSHKFHFLKCWMFSFEG